MTDSWFGMRLPDTQGIWALRYPTQLLSAGADFLIFLLLLTWERIFRDKGQGESSYPFDGFIFLLFLGLYSGKRVLIQFLRGDNTPVWGLFNATQFFFLTVVIMVSILIAIGLKARKSPPRWNTISFFSRSRPGFRDPKSEIRDHRSETGKN